MAEEDVSEIAALQNEVAALRRVIVSHIRLLGEKDAHAATCATTMMMIPTIILDNKPKDQHTQRHMFHQIHCCETEMQMAKMVAYLRAKEGDSFDISV